LEKNRRGDGRLRLLLSLEPLVWLTTNQTENPLTNELKLPADAQPNAGGSEGPRLQRWFGCATFVFLIYVCFCLSLTTLAYRRPLPTFDRYLYAGAVASLRYSDPATIHRIARSEFDAQPSPFRFESVAAEPYFADVYNNPYHFVQQLGFCRVKLGYVAAGYMLWRAGLPILVSLRLISACCFFVVGLVILAWSRDALLSAVFLLTPSVLSMGRMVTVDPLSTLVVFLALFALAGRKDFLAALLLTASVFLRFDSAVIVLIVLLWMVWRNRIRLSAGILFAAIALGSAILANHITGYYGWRVLMQHSFIKPEIEPITHPIPISFAGYLHAIGELRVIPYTFMTIWALVAAATWKKLSSESIFRELLPLAGICIVARLAIYPNVEDRYFLWAYLLAGVALIQTAQSLVREKEEPAH